MSKDPLRCCIGAADGIWRCRRLSRQQLRLPQTLCHQPRQRAYVEPGRSSDTLVTWETPGAEHADAAVWLELVAFGLVAGWSGWLMLTSGGHSLLHEHSYGPLPAPSQARRDNPSSGHANGQAAGLSSATEGAGWLAGASGASGCRLGLHRSQARSGRWISAAARNGRGLPLLPAGRRIGCRASPRRKVPGPAALLPPLQASSPPDACDIKGVQAHAGQLLDPMAGSGSVTRSSESQPDHGVNGMRLSRPTSPSRAASPSSAGARRPSLPV